MNARKAFLCAAAVKFSSGFRVLLETEFGSGYDSREAVGVPFARYTRSITAAAAGSARSHDDGYRTDDLFLMRQARRFGPVFKTNISGQFMACIADHKRSRAILNENVQRLAGVNAPYDALVSGGFLRCQTGEMHRTTRRIFTRALQSDLVGTNAGALREIVQRELSVFASACETRPPHNDELLRTLDRIATAMLLLLFFLEFVLEIRHSLPY